MEYFVCLQKPSESGKVYLIAGPFPDEESVIRVASKIEEKYQKAEADRGINEFFFGSPDSYAPDDVIGYDSIHHLRTHRARGNITLHLRSYLGYGVDGPQVVFENDRKTLPDWDKGYLAGLTDCKSDVGTSTGIQTHPVPGSNESMQAFERWFHVSFDEKHKGESMHKSSDWPWFLGYYEGYKAEAEEIRSKRK